MGNKKSMKNWKIDARSKKFVNVFPSNLPLKFVHSQGFCYRVQAYLATGGGRIQQKMMREDVSGRFRSVEGGRRKEESLEERVGRVRVKRGLKRMSS